MDALYNKEERRNERMLAFGKSIGESRIMESRMMGDIYGFGIIHVLLSLITWLVIVALLVSLTRWLWLKGDKEKKGK